jgi:hypothetical protein
MDPAVPTSGVCVLGMSRSGTSLTARLLRLAGVHLGPERELLQSDLHQLRDEGEDVLARAREANPDGFFEHYRISRLNERVLRALGGNWREPPPMPDGWELSEELAAEREEAKGLLAESFGERRPWGWKDPRTSLTLPFWQAIVPDMRSVICLRNPLDVAASLQRRDGIAIEQGIDLWRRYTGSALANTAGRRRLVVAYESYFDDPGKAVSRLAAFVGRKEALDCAETRRGLLEAVDEGQWRHRTSRLEAVMDGALPPEALSLYLLADTYAKGMDGVPVAESA